MRISACLIILIPFLVGCSDELSDYQVVYFNDFEDGNLEGIFNGNIISFQGNQVIGNYNNSGFTLIINDIPKHKYINIRINLFIHDSWDGNIEEPNGPDIWGFSVDEWVKYRRKSSHQMIFETSFSNDLVCNDIYCSRQSYPQTYPNVFQPRTGSVNNQFPGVCHLANRSNGTVLYRIEKVYPHTGSSTAIRFYDLLVQNNTVDPLCDESWSIGEIEIGIW